MIAIEFAGKCTVRFERPGERLFEHDATSSGHQSGCVVTVISCGRNNHCSVADARSSQAFNRSEYGDLQASGGKERACALRVRFGQCYQLAALSIAGEFERMKGMNCAHSTETGDG